MATKIWHDPGFPTASMAGPPWSLCCFLLISLMPTDWVQSLGFCFPSLLTPLMILSNHVAFDITYRLMIFTYLSPELSPELSTHISICLFVISAWVTSRHFKLYIPTLLSCCLSLFSKWQFHISIWLGPKLCSHPWLIFFTPPIHFNIYEYILNQVIFATSTATALMQANIISHLESCYSFLSGLLGSGIAHFQTLQSVFNSDPVKI